MDLSLQTFLEHIAEVLEVPSVTLDDEFRAVPMWSSLVGFSTMVMIDLEYGRQVTAADLKAARTIRDLARLAGVEGL